MCGSRCSIKSGFMESREVVEFKRIFPLGDMYTE
jgi:hypothetical protein